MLEAISFKEDNVVTMRFLLGGANQTAIGSKDYSKCGKQILNIVEHVKMDTRSG